MAREKFIESEMYNNAYLTMRVRYPHSEGYIILPQDATHKGYRPDFLIKKQIRYRGASYYKKIIVEVKAVPVITLFDIIQINCYARNHSGKHSFIIGKYLVIPTFADISKVKHLLLKSGIRVIRLRGFRRRK